MLNKVLRDDDPTEIEFAVVVVRAINSRRVERGDMQKASQCGKMFVSNNV